VNPLRHLLLVAVLLFAQLAAGAHAVGHAAGDERGLPTHTCELCLAAHDLGTALPALAALPAIAPPRLVPAATSICGRASLPAPTAAQRGPPAS
jgi:hypothetical protein